jgi:uncharacterized protein YprB with RNaseH-like and TPR domain
MTERVFDCPVCGVSVTTTDGRKMYCTKKCADRARNHEPVQLGKPGLDVIEDLKGFGKLSVDAKAQVLLGQANFSVVMFDIEATHLKPNVGRILCCSFKPIGQPVYTFDALERRFKQPDVYDDTALASAILDELEKYDIIVGWNSKNFDVKFVNSRAIRGGRQVKPAQYHVDGMWSYRSKLNAWSGLARAQQFLLPDNETEKTSIEWDKWMQMLGWDAKLRKVARDEIVDHCEKDVIVLEDVYTTLVKANVIRSIRRDGGVL